MEKQSCQKQLTQLMEILGEVHDLRAARAVLSWDQQTYMPPQGAAARARQMATLSRIAHEKFTDSSVGELLTALSSAKLGDYDSWPASLVRVAHREYEMARRIPASFVARKAELTGQANRVWALARRDNDFGQFQPLLQEIVEIARQEADYLGYEDSPYDALLGKYEPGLSTKQVSSIFSKLKSELAPLVKQYVDNVQPGKDFLRQKFPRETQWKLSLELLQILGYDFARGRQDLADHPFTTAFSVDDVRVTNRLDETDPLSSIFSTAHEYGHAMYELGIPRELERTPLGTGSSPTVHESQSRFWENMVARSASFWEFFYPKVQAAFPDALGSVSWQQFFGAVNRVRPSLIRVEADELTYNMHILLRFELEKGLMEGTINSEQLPSLWREKMEQYLGIVPTNDREGVLQDIHWSWGMFGYFPTYTLGTVLAAQIHEKMQDSLPDLAEQHRQGDFSRTNQWLNDNIHVHGAKFILPELIDRVLGRPLETEPYLRYIANKYAI